MASDDLSLSSSGWLSPSDTGFRTYIHRLLASNHDTRSGRMELQKHQLVVRKFLTGTPYRGLVVFHGLGSGKTCAAVAAAESIAVNEDKKVFVVLPASLQRNFQEEIGKCSKSLKNIHYVRMNGVKVIDEEKEKKKKEEARKKGEKYEEPEKGIHVSNMTIDKLDVNNSVIVVDEVHNLVGYKKNDSKRGNALYHLFHNARNVKIVCLSGTVIVNDPFELGILLNMVSGPSRSFVLKSSRAGSDSVTESLDKDLSVGRYVINGTTLTVYPVPEGFRRKSSTSPLLVKEKVDYKNKPHGDLRQRLRALVGTVPTMVNSQVYPETEEDFDRKFVDKSNGVITNKTAFQMAATGMVSHFTLTAAEARSKGFPDVLPEIKVVLDMSDTMFERYSEQRAVEISIEQSNARKAKRTGTVQQGSFRPASRMICNFAFEKTDIRPFKSSLRRTNNFDIDHMYDDKLDQALAHLKKNNYAALKGERLATQSPKMAAILERVKKASGPVLVYSNFRSMEGVGIFALVLEAAGFSRMKLNDSGDVVDTDAKKPVFHEFAGASEDPNALKLFNGDNKAWNKKRPAGKPPIDVLLITGAGAEGISLRGVREVHIMEPHWNEIRIQQVIGRAARLESHGHLPPEQRNVSVYRYAMRLADGEMRNDQQIRRHDKNVTTDEYVYERAMHKAALSETFLSALKEVAIDCGMYPESLTCFGSFQNTDEKPKAKRKLRIAEQAGVMYIIDDVVGKRYSYAEFKKTKKLVPA